ncbi:putative nuclease HARBI1 [Mantella aurantiaca]
MGDEEIRTQFRLTREAIEHHYRRIEDTIKPTTQCCHAIPGKTRLLGALYILGSGSFQTTSAAISGYSQPSMSRVFIRVIDAIMQVAPRFVAFPQTEAEWRKLKIEFFRIAGMPNVLGAIDGTHVAPRPPKRMAIRFRNRKQYHSLNVQLVCDGKMRIMYARTGFPGSCHDAFILRRTALYRQFEGAEFPPGWLVGNVYICEIWRCGFSPVAMAHIRFPRDTLEQRCKALQNTRGVVERTIGLLKSRFLRLARPGGERLYSPRKCSKIIMACIVLHNICLQHRNSWDVEEREPKVWHPPTSGMVPLGRYPEVGSSIRGIAQSNGLEYGRRYTIHMGGFLGNCYCDIWSTTCLLSA